MLDDPTTVEQGGPARGTAPAGAHVSVAGGLSRAPGRARAIGADALQLFTSSPQRWRARPTGTEEADAFRRERNACGVRFAVAHDSYLINLASPDPELRRRSERAFRAELQRSAALGLDAVVTHPGNATDGDREAAIRRNAAAIAAALAAVPGPRVLVETTAGTGTALGWRFEELAALIDAVPGPGRERVGVCLDTAHVFAAGYDLRSDAPGVLDALERSVGPGRLMLLHVNDSAAPLGSRRDRHAELGSGEIGLDGLGALLSDPRVARVPRVLETPKGDDPEAADRRNLSLLRGLDSRAP